MKRTPARSDGISLVGVPMDLASDLRGVDMGPSAIRIAGLARRLESLGYRVEDLGNLAIPHAIVAGRGSPRLKFVSPVRVACAQLARTVEAVLRRGYTPLVLGGDHSIAMGTLAGLTRFAARGRPAKRFGLLWVDAHGDCNTPRTTPSGNIHGMPLAVALGMGDARLTRLTGRAPMADPARSVLFGARNLDSGERRNIRRLGLRVFTMRDIDEHGVFALMREALAIVTDGTAGFHLSFDMDAIDPSSAPGVGTPVSGGLTIREAHLIMELVADARKMISCEVVEVNPVLDQRNATARLAVELLSSAFGESIL